jgi:hypothetical protein
MTNTQIEIGSIVLNEQWFYTLQKSTLGKVIEINGDCAKIEVIKFYDFNKNSKKFIHKTKVCKLSNLVLSSDIKY